MASELYNIIEGVSREKGIDPQIVVNAVEDAIVMATRKHYKSQENFRAKLDKEVAAAPHDPDVRLRYAEGMFVAGQVDLAVSKLDEAIAVIGGLDKTTDDSAKDRIYASASPATQRATPTS